MLVLLTTMSPLFFSPGFALSSHFDSERTSEGKELLSQKVPGWQQACAEPNKLPERAMLLAQQMSGVGGAPGPHTHPHHPGGPHPKGAMAISDPISGAKPLPVPPELAALMAGGTLGQQRLMQGGAEGGVASLNGSAGPHGGGDDYQQWMEAKAAKSSGSQAGAQGYSNTLPVRKGAPAKHKAALPETRTLPRSSSMAAGLEKNGRARVQAIFSHAAGDNSTLLSFAAGDVITLLVPEARDGWHYGENEKNRMRGWFPFSYTHLLTDREEEPGPQLRVHNLQHGKSSSTGNLLEREDASLPLPDYSMHSRMAAQNAAVVLRQQQQPLQRPYSMMTPGYPQQAPEEYEQRFPMSTEPPSEPTVEAPPSPPVDYNADVDDDGDDDDLSTGSALYDLVRKTPTPPGLY
ncbi:brain-specific angiogenesis inhibitor 1-associated protein 2-like [Gadus chalcogrammus]|uniref:brain-specific angiogenesis inhibitor 1-associated protein 2-like n=2 Tax=Gadus TaxID=8048 RepID=UPI0024C4B721|nr:brain-specific angiogenesis inhibitor 1-associated protein 2-like [Gadus chalcogrammus]